MGEGIVDTIQAIIDRAVSDPDFLQRLMGDPLGTLEDEGLDISALSADDLQALRNAKGRSWHGLVEVLQQRISRMGITGTTLRPPGQH